MYDTVKAVEKHRELIFDTERFVWEHPETGFKEYETSKYMANVFESLGYSVTRAEGITGFYTTLDTGRKGPTLLILGELDSVICAAHPNANKTTGAVHACGHNVQCAALVGIAAALKEEGALEGLCGKIKLCAVPAEELLEVTYRSELIKKGVIKYFGGKTEFLSRGYFDDVDLAFMVHAGGGDAFSISKGSVGCIAKRVIYKGVAAHAGGSPWDGKNALYAATCGLNAANALRETFRESDIIRFHPIITVGGQMVNAIPDTVEIESYVRGRTYDAILKANERINRALIGAALSIGANVEIIDSPGYAPHENSELMADAMEEAVGKVVPSRIFRRESRIASGSTDMGDLSRVMPIIHPYAPGSIGKGHGADYFIVDHEGACVDNAKVQVELARLLLGNGAEKAKKVIEAYEPEFKSIKDFLDFNATIFSSGDRIKYNEDGTATVKCK